jgi:hypothetical protein
VQLHPNTPDTISWNLTNDRKYTTRSAYRAQFLGSTPTNFNLLIWKVWAPPKCKFFSWLVIQNRIWTSDRLQARGWPNPQICPLCHLRPESGIHLFKDCRFTRRIWVEIACWLGNINLHPDAWVASDSVADWWSALDHTICVAKQGLRSLIILVCWEVWKERNARIFEHFGTPNHLLLQKIKDEAQLWISAGAKHLARLVQRF